MQQTAASRSVMTATLPFRSLTSWIPTNAWTIETKKACLGIFSELLTWCYAWTGLAHSPPTDVEQLKIRDTDDTGGLPCGKPVPSFHRQHWDFCGIRSAMHCKTVQPQWILCSDLWAQLVKSPNGYGHDKKWPRRMGSSTINNEIRTRNHATIVFFFKKWGFALLLKTLRPVKVSSKIKPNQKHTQTQIHHETPSNWYSSMTQTWACSAHIDHWMQHCLTLLLRMERLSAQPSDLQGVLPAEWITIRFIIYIYYIIMYIYNLYIHMVGG